MKWLEQCARRFLQHRGWVVFWLDERSQFCSAEVNWSLGRGVCWLRQYRNSLHLPDFPDGIAPIYERRKAESLTKDTPCPPSF